LSRVPADALPGHVRPGEGKQHRAVHGVLRPARCPSFLCVRHPGRDAGALGVGGQEQPQPPAGEAQQFSGGEYTIRLVTLRPNGIDAQGAFVRLFNGTPDDRTDDTVVDLAVAELAITRG